MIYLGFCKACCKTNGVLDSYLVFVSMSFAMAMKNKAATLLLYIQFGQHEGILLFTYNYLTIGGKGALLHLLYKRL